MPESVATVDVGPVRRGPHKGVKTRQVVTAPKEIADEICRRLIDGETVNAICADKRMPSIATLWRWRRADPSLEHRMTQAAGLIRQPVKTPMPTPDPERGPETWTPLGIMLHRMRELWADGQAEVEDKREAISIAKDAAPYVHPRLSAVDARITHRDLRDMGDDDLLRELALLREQSGQLLRLPADIGQAEDAVLDMVPGQAEPVVLDQDPGAEGAIPDFFDVDCQQER
jgi:hypothetical protein